MFVDFEGTIGFAKIFEGNRDMGDNLPDGEQKEKIDAEQGHYVCNVYITKETKKEMKAAGIPDGSMTMFKMDDDDNHFFKCKRPHFNPKLLVDEGGKLMGPPAVVYLDDEGNNQPWDFDENGYIGNGSKVKVRVDVWKNTRACIVTLHAVKVIELEEFKGDGEGGGLAGF